MIYSRKHMTRESAINYLKSSGISETQIDSIVRALSTPKVKDSNDDWILCSEELPDLDCSVLTSDCDELVRENRLVAVEPVEWDHNHRKIIAWKELPAAYELSEEDVNLRNLDDAINYFDNLADHDWYNEKQKEESLKYYMLTEWLKNYREMLQKEKESDE